MDIKIRLDLSLCVFVYKIVNIPKWYLFDISWLFTLAFSEDAHSYLLLSHGHSLGGPGII